MNERRRPTIPFEDAQIIFRNFSGKEDQYNRAGDKKFTLLIEDEKLAAQMQEDGWNIRSLPAREEGEPERLCVEVAVSFKNFPPKVTMICGTKKTILDDESINVLDFSEIEFIDLVISPYNWNVNGKEGVKAYLKTMYVTIVQDEFAAKYENLDGDDAF